MRLLRHYLPSHNIRARLVLSVGLLAIFSSFLLSFTVGREATLQVQEDKGHTMQQLALHMSRELDIGMYERYREIGIVAGMEVIRDPAVSWQQKQQFLDLLKSSYDHYAWIGLTDAEGKIVVGTDHLLVGKSVAEREWFLRGREGMHVGDVHDAFLLAKLLPQPKDDPLPLRLVDISAPIHDAEGKLVGVLCGHLSWHWALRVRRALLEPTKSHGTVDILVLNKGRSILLGTPELPSSTAPLEVPSVLAASRGENHYTTEDWPDQKKYLTGFARAGGYSSYPGLGWLVLVRQSSGEAFAAAGRLEQRTLLISLPFSLLFLLLSWMVINRIVRPMAAIAHVADCLRQGDTTATIPNCDVADETGILARSLRDLVATLESQKVDLLSLNQQLQADIVYRIQVEEQLRLSAQVFENSIEGIVITDSQERIISVNKAFLYVTGFSAEEVIGQTPRMLKSGRQDAQFYQQMWRSLQENGSWQGEVWNRRKSGEVFPEWLTISAMKRDDGQIGYYIALFTDISTLKESQQALLLAKERAEDANRVKSEFLLVMSHEMRTPMNVIMGMGELLEETGLSEEQQSILARQKNAANRLLELIDDVLDMSKIESGQLQLNRMDFDLRSLMKSIRDIMGPIAQVKQLDFQVNIRPDTPLKLRGDVRRLRQILINLVDNGIKFTDRGCVEVSVATEAEALQSGVIRFTVQDSGIGISPDMQEKNFR
ncbi:MAG: PAS domain S-box protein [Magnetococcales bacterium]|nr:PAS domain S-box protein [Magnetococcales bacterium]